ncbi:MAG: ComF family protein [Desulfovibrionaceae bacterium]|nr:ComF family protein [Desulfovibrionaceae bacterium]MBF0514524.1 ComF family protein [Desulfovibrionaceae bacterium]
MSAVVAFFRRIAQGLGRRCPVCGRVVPEKGLCQGCARELAPRLSGFCPGCGTLYENEPPTVCFACRDDPRPWSRLSFHGRYDGALRDLILHYKFSGALGQGRVLQGLLREAYLREGAASGEEKLVVPVPLHPRRLRFRGYNQSLELSRALAGLPGLIPCPAGLRRTRHTTPQANLGQKERLTNLKDAFAADPGRVAGKPVVLVDDVMTTGSTLEWAAKALKRGGATRVECLVLARS